MINHPARERIKDGEEDSEESDGEECGYEEKLQYLLCEKYPEGATKHS